MLGPKLARLCSDEVSSRAVAVWARSLSMGAELTPEEWALASEMEAVFEVMYVMAAADGDLAEDELALLSQSLAAIIQASEERGASRFEVTLPLLKLGEILGRFESLLAQGGPSERLESVGRRILTRDGRRLALSLAAGVAFVDDFVAEGEMKTLDELARVLGLGHEEALATLREAQRALG